MAFSETISTVTHTNLLLDSLGGVVTEKVTVLQDADNADGLSTGALLGKITKGAVTSVADGAGTDGANTGDATCVPDATAPLQVNSQLGTYSVKFTAATKAGVYDPNGAYLGEMTAGTAWVKQIKFLVTAGSTPMVAGDGFAITVAEGSGKVAAFDPDGVSGEEVPFGVLGNDVEIASADATGAFAYLKGKFNQNAMSVKTGVTLLDYKDALRNIGIYLVDATSEV
jgi:hypothetical protein